MPKIKPLARRADIVVQELGKEILIYDLRTDKAFNLNESSMLVWQLSDGNKTTFEIADTLTKTFNLPVNEEFVWFALEQLKKEDLIESQISPITHFLQLSRREIIQRIGLTSMVTLPVISILVAPISTQAVSCIHTNPPCNPMGTFCPTVATPTRNTDCCSCVCGAATATPAGPRSRCT